MIKTCVAVVTVIEEENIAAKRCLSRVFKSKEILKIDAVSEFPYLKCSEPDSDGAHITQENIDIAYFNIAGAGNVDPAFLCSSIIAEIGPAALILVGVAGGRLGKNSDRRYTCPNRCLFLRNWQSQRWQLSIVQS